MNITRERPLLVTLNGKVNLCYYYKYMITVTLHSYIYYLIMKHPLNKLIHLQTFIVGGSDYTVYPNDYVEVFDAKNKTISRVVDDQANWVKVPVPYLTSMTRCTCIVPMNNKNAFAILGGFSL
jgi:hypothetical protein